MSILIVVDSPDRWPLVIPGVQEVSARAYLTDPSFSELRGAVVFNMCRSYSYQRSGYYVSLLAEARGHRPKPSVNAIQDLRSRTILRIASDDLSELIDWSLAPIRSSEFELSIYFGQALAKRYKRLASAIFDQFQAPLLRARFTRDDNEWTMRHLGPIPTSEIPESHRDFVVAAAQEHFAHRRWTPRRKKSPRATMAILHGTPGTQSASTQRAIRRFQRAADSLGIATEVVTKEDYGRVAEFDALFIRETTAVNHHTFRFSSRAAAEGLVVIDDPRSIVRCSNKVYMKELLERHEVPIPRTLVVHQGNRGEVATTLGLPCVLKQPDSAFSLGVVRVADQAELDRELDRLLEKSELVVAQEWLPTEFDWRVGTLAGNPLYVCRYYMAHRHWQILKHEEGGGTQFGRVECVPVEAAPRAVVRAAVNAARRTGDGLYGIDVKQVRRKVYVIEVNDNPSIDAGYEDRVLGSELYLRIMRHFLERIEERRGGRD